MKRFHTLQQKIIFYVMSVAILLAVLITITMSVGSIVSTHSILLDNMQVTARLASQNLSSNLHLLTERMYNLASQPVFSDEMAANEEKMAQFEAAELQIEFVWLSAYDLSGQKLYGNELAPASISDTEYFAKMTQTGNIVIGDPYYADNLLQLCVGAPLKSEDSAVIGYLVGSYKYDLLNDVLSMLILGNTGSACILNQEGVIIGDRDTDNVISMQNIYELYPSSKNTAIYDKILASQTGSAVMKQGFTSHYIGYAPVPGTNWSLVINAPRMEFMGSTVFSVAFTVLLSLFLLIAAAAVIVPVSRKISDSLGSVTVRLKALAEGDLTTEVTLSDTISETTTLTNSLSQTITSLNSYIQDIRSCLGALSSGDYTVEIPDNFTGDFSSIRDSLEHITDSLNRTMQQMNLSSVEGNRNSMEVSDFAGKLLDGSHKQDELLAQLEQSMAAITASIERNKENVAHMEACSRNAAEKTALGDSYMNSMLDTMTQIHSAVTEISQISQLIENISSQTNLLALNASIEAARAGEAGRGFAVVASEIGQLSGQTTDALRQTGEIIAHSADTIQKGLEIAQQTAKAFQEIEAVTGQYQELSAEISNAADEQTSSVAYVNSQLSALKDISTENRHLSEETDKLAADSLAHSESLKEYVASVKIKETF